MAALKKKTRKKKKTPKRYRFQLGLPGVASVTMVMLCLFFWMFLMGIWAGQTILLPVASSDKNKPSNVSSADTSPVKILKPSAKKKPPSS